MDQNREQGDSVNLKKWLTTLLIFSILASAIATILFFSREKDLLEAELLRKEILIKKTAQIDSTISQQQRTNDSIFTKYISGCNILINGKEVTTSELVAFLNKQLKEITSLHDSLNRLTSLSRRNGEEANFYRKKMEEFIDSFKVYRGYAELAKETFQSDFSYKKDDDNRLKMIMAHPTNTPDKDSLFVYRFMLDMARRKYSLRYEYEFKDGKLTATEQSEKLDSAMITYEFFRDRIKKDKNGNWIIRTPLFYKKPK